MSVPVDERVVALKFNNQQFEEGTKTTMSTLSKLKEALNLATAPKGFKELEQVANQTSFAGLEAGIQKLQERFSTFGIVGMRIIENLTDTVMNTLGKAVSFVSDTIVSGGIRRAMNIENAHFQLQALLKDEEKVQAVMDDAMTSVDGTAYAYDEAAKAAAQFAASGLESGEEMLSALRGIVGTAAMTNSEYEGISRIFTTVAGQGRLMGDQLLQLSSRGLNAASTIADFMNRVNDGSAQVTDSVRNTVKEITGGAKITEGVVREMVSDGEISFQIFSAAMTEAFADSAERANETFTGAFSNMKSALARIGAEFVSPLVEQNSDVIGLFNTLRLKINDVKKALTWDEKGSAISGLSKESTIAKEDISALFDTISEKGSVGREDLNKLSMSGIKAYGTLLDYVNGVNDGSIRAKYAVRETIKEITGGMEQTNKDILNLVESGKIDLATFTSAMEWAYGDQRGLSKQFTDWFLDTVKGLATAIDKIDLSGPMQVFYYGVEIVKNGIKGLISLVKPLGQAFADVFLGFSTQNVVDVLDKVELFTAKLRLSEESSNNLRDAFTGLFNVAKLLIDIFFKLVGAIIPISNPIAETGNSVLGLAGAVGRALTKFTEWVRSSTRIKKAYTALSEGVNVASEAVGKLISKTKDFLSEIYHMPWVQETIQKVSNVFNNFGTYSKDALQEVIKWAGRVREKIASMIPEEVYSAVNAFVSKIRDMVSDLKNLSWQDVINFISDMKENLVEFLESIRDNNILSTFVEKMKEFFNGIGKAIEANGVSEKIKTLKDTLGGFLSWLGEIFGPFFEGFNFDSVVGAAGVGGGIWGIIKMFESLDKVTGTLGGVSGVLGAVKGALHAYETDLHSKTLLKIAGAIALLAIAIAALSNIEGEKLISAASALAIAGGVLLWGLTELKKAVNAGKSAPTALTTFAKGIGEALKKFGTALEIGALGSVARNFALGILIVVGAIAAMWYLYEKHKTAIDAVLPLLGTIASILAGFTIVVGFLGSLGGVGGRSVLGLGIGVLALTGSLMLVIMALDQLFKLDFPENWEFKFEVFKKLLLAVALLGIAAGLSGAVAGENKMAVTPIIGMAVMLYGLIDALDKMFKMDFPDNWEFKFGILKELLLYCAGVALAVGFAGRVSNGESTGFSSLLALCAFLTVCVEAIGKLNEYPYKAMQRSVISIGVVLLAVSVVLRQAAKVGNDKGAAKTVQAMVVLLLGVVGSLWLLSKMEISELVAPLVILGVICGMLALVFAQISKIASNGTDTLVPMVGMVSLLLIIVGGLSLLSEEPWESIAAAGGSMAAVLGVLAGVFIVIAKLGSDIEMSAIIAFDALVIAVLGISYSLGMLATHDWDSILAAAGGISLVLVAMAGVFALITSMGAEEVIGSVLTLTAAIIPLIGVAVVLGVLASFDFDNLLDTALALTVTLVGLSAALGICALVGSFSVAGLIGIGLLMVFITALGALLYAMGSIFSDPQALKILDDGGAALIKIGESLGAFVGAIIGGIGVGLTSGLPKIGQNLSDFADNAQPFFDQMNNIKQSTLDGASKLASMILVMCSADLLSGISGFFNLFSGGKSSFVKFGKELAEYGPYVGTFADSIKNVNATKAKAVAEMTELMASASKSLPKKSEKKTTLKEFGSDLEEYGESVVKFSEKVVNVDPASVEGARAVGEIMAVLEGNLPTDQDSLMGWLTGAKDFDDFGFELESFGESIVRFAEKTVGITEDSVVGAYNAGMLLAQLNEALPSEGGLKGLIFGDSDLADFGDSLSNLAAGLLTFSNSTSLINTESLAAVLAQAFRLVDLSKYVQETGLLGLKTFTGTMEQCGTLGLTAFTGSMYDSDSDVQGAVGHVFKTAGNTSKKESKTLTQQVREAATDTALELAAGFVVPPAISGVVSAISQLTGLIKTETDEGLPDVTFQTIGRDTVNALILGQKAMFKPELDTANALGDQTVTAVRTKLHPTVMTPIGELSTQSVAQGISNRIQFAKDAASGVTGETVRKFVEGMPATTFNSLGSSATENLAAGVLQNRQSAINAATEIATSIVGAFQSAINMDAIMAVGANVAAGLKKGIDSQTSAVVDTAKSMAGQVTNTVQKKFQIASPSKVFTQIGEFLVEGLQNGILNKLGIATDAGINLADGTLDPVKDAVNKALELLNGTTFDANPVITPELDLSNIISGSNEINDLFNQGFSANLNSALGVNSNFGSGFFDADSLFGDQLADLQAQMAELQNTPTTTFDNKFYIQGEDPDAIAEKVSQIISKQVSRKESAWA